MSESKYLQVVVVGAAETGKEKAERKVKIIICAVAISRFLDFKNTINKIKLMDNVLTWWWCATSSC